MIMKKVEKRKHMFDFIKKSMSVGLGLAFLTKEKIETIAKDLSERGELEKKDVKKFIEDLSEKSEEAKKKLDGRIERIIKAILEKMNLVSRDDFLKLEKQVKQIKKDLKEEKAKE
jgi:polyhydroxyalkanoate synthesis regulator phasin